MPKIILPACSTENTDICAEELRFHYLCIGYSVCMNLHAVEMECLHDVNEQEDCGPKDPAHVLVVWHKMHKMTPKLHLYTPTRGWSAIYSTTEETLKCHVTKPSGVPILVNKRQIECRTSWEEGQNLRQW